MTRFDPMLTPEERAALRDAADALQREAWERAAESRSAWPPVPWYSWALAWVGAVLVIFAFALIAVTFMRGVQPVAAC